jgi:hypothetical protein
MVRWFKRRVLSKEDFGFARTWLIVFAILHLGSAAQTIAEYQAESRIPLSALGSMAISVFCVLAAAYYQKRLDHAQTIAGIMLEPDRDVSPKRQ